MVFDQNEFKLFLQSLRDKLNSSSSLTVVDKLINADFTIPNTLDVAQVSLANIFLTERGLTREDKEKIEFYRLVMMKKFLDDVTPQLEQEGIFL